MPSYLVWCHERGQTSEDARRVDAPCPESAVKTWARADDAKSADYLIVGGSPTEVSVVEDREGATVQRFFVFGETEPVYYVRALPAGAGGHG